jgi:toxin ParE1/3/4
VTAVRYSRRAQADLASIDGYLRAQNPAAARDVRALIETSAARLGHFPRAGRETDRPGLHVLPLAKYPYLVFYRVVRDEVHVVHVRHAARRPFVP